MDAKFLKKPRYLEISDALEEKIQKGELVVGFKLPSEKELCDQWQVSSITVRRSLSELAKKGLIVTRQGLGTFVVKNSHVDKGAVSSHLLGLVIPSTSDYHNGRIVESIERTARGFGYSLVIKYSFNDPQEETRSIQMLLDRKVMGLLISPVTGDSSETLVSCAKLTASKTPFVLLDRYLPILTTYYVTTDNIKGGYDVARHLIELGHRRIACLRNMPNTSGDEREEGYRKAMEEAGISIDETLILRRLGYESELVKAAVSDFMDQKQGKFTAIFAENDGLARIVYDVFRERNIRIPDDVAVVGFDDAPYAKLLMPSMTTVFQPDREIAEKAVNILQNLILGVKVDETRIVLTPKLIIRDSTKNKSDKTAIFIPPKTRLNSVNVY